MTDHEFEGTPRGYMLHIHLGQTPCPDCDDAWKEFARANPPVPEPVLTEADQRRNEKRRKGEPRGAYRRR